MAVCTGECNLVISSGVRKKGRSSTEGEGVWILHSIAHPPSCTGLLGVGLAGGWGSGVCKKDQMRADQRWGNKSSAYLPAMLIFVFTNTVEPPVSKHPKCGNCFFSSLQDVAYMGKLSLYSLHFLDPSQSEVTEKSLHAQANSRITEQVKI